MRRREHRLRLWRLLQLLQLLQLLRRALLRLWLLQGCTVGRNLVVQLQKLALLLRGQRLRWERLRARRQLNVGMRVSRVGLLYRELGVVRRRVVVYLMLPLELLKLILDVSDMGGGARAVPWGQGAVHVVEGLEWLRSDGELVRSRVGVELRSGHGDGGDGVLRAAGGPEGRVVVHEIVDVIRGHRGGLLWRGQPHRGRGGVFQLVARAEEGRAVVSG